MDASEHSELPAGQPGPRFEPYVRLLRSLLPRVSSVALFGPDGELKWTTDPMLGPDLTSAVDEALVAAHGNDSGPGQSRMLEGALPVYLCPLRLPAAGGL